MNILFLGDVMGKSGRQVLKNQLPQLKRDLQIDTVIVNGENAAGGFGITPKICEEFYELGVNVITTGNHVWDQKEIIPYISKDNYILRPHNFPQSVPGKGFVIYKDAMDRKVLVINVMARLFMDPLNDPIETIYNILDNYKIGENVSAIIIDVHGEASSEKMAIGHTFDGIVSFIIGTHTHIPTLDAQILENGTAFQSDAGMCGDYDSVIGGEKEGWVARFKHKMPTGRINVSSGEATLCGVFVCINDTDGMAVHIEPIIKGPHLINRYPEKI
ncbi:MAG: TIGR00282 family metallophosphoesterase [Alphaproteobacteria bacterium]|nr:MAG: TIGR00282 family metallophosphoesterase [Alphaproteobacteria bacterium]|tara:strand:- start:1158 stop:1976 length:819 start_codon:yes stop_codon:yes gene_type:complete